MKVEGVDTRDALERGGFVILRDVFSAEEIAGMRDEATALLATTNVRPLRGGLCVGPVSRDSDLARRLLNDARLACHCGGELPAQIHVHANTYCDWHADGPIRVAPVSGSAAWMYQIAIYLQDHPGRDGLSVVPGSHKEEDTPHTPLHIDTRAGDIVVFNHRVRHAGRLPNRAERLAASMADSLRRLRLVDESGSEGLQRRFLRFRQLIEPAPAADRFAIFVRFVTDREMRQRYAAFSRDPHDERDRIDLRKLFSSLRYIIHGKSS